MLWSFISTQASCVLKVTRIIQRESRRDYPRLKNESKTKLRDSRSKFHLFRSHGCAMTSFIYSFLSPLEFSVDFVAIFLSIFWTNIGEQGRATHIVHTIHVYVRVWEAQKKEKKNDIVTLDRERWFLSGCEPWQRIGVARRLHGERRGMEGRRERRSSGAAGFTEDAGPRPDEDHRSGRRRGHAGNIVLRSRRSLQEILASWLWLKKLIQSRLKNLLSEKREFKILCISKPKSRKKMQ